MFAPPRVEYAFVTLKAQRQPAEVTHARIRLQRVCDGRAAMILVVNPAIHPDAQAHAKQSLGRHKKMTIKEWRCPSCKCEFEGPGPAGGQVICPECGKLADRAFRTPPQVDTQPH